jgi:asparagine synthase (glutamine-hydrolysing)
MCGIAGKVSFDGAPIDQGWLRDACALVGHRGPDGRRVLVEDGKGGASVGFAHARLKIIDLAPAADQPMDSNTCPHAGAGLSLVFNGEIYNYRELRRELQARGHRFATDSDTEVILHLYEERGADCVLALRGMFACAIWDRARQRLMLARDRVGKKPIYYRFSNRTLWFASEARAILADRAVPLALNRQAVRGYLALGYVAGPDSAFDGVMRLPPAHRALVDGKGVQIDRYWELTYEPKLDIAAEDAVARVRDLLSESVRLRLISDVPLGAFLSGGVDSSAVVALMCRHAPGRVKTFSIGFDDQEYNELPHARRVATALRTEHHEFVVSPDLQHVLPKLAWHYGEPYADSSAVPTYHLARLARQQITVALTGDGGDESFAGYRRYLAERALSRAGVQGLALRIASAMRAALPVPRRSRSRLYDATRLLAAVGLPADRRYAGWFGFFDPASEILDPDFAAATSPAAGPSALLARVPGRSGARSDRQGHVGRRRRVSARRSSRQDRHRDDGRRPRGAGAAARPGADGVCRSTPGRREASGPHDETSPEGGPAGPGARRGAGAAEDGIRHSDRRVAAGPAPGDGLRRAGFAARAAARLLAARGGRSPRRRAHVEPRVARPSSLVAADARAVARARVRRCPQEIACE